MLVYVKDGRIITESSKQRAKLIRGISKDTEPDAELTDEEWDACNGIIRLVNGELQYGYTEAELASQRNAERQEEITELTQKLRNTDYIVIKLAEGAATTSEYTEQIAQRQEWRDKINELQDAME